MRTAVCSWVVLWVLVGTVGCGSDDDLDTGPHGDGGEAADDSGPVQPAPLLRFEPVALELDETTASGHQHVSTFAFIPGTNELLLTELHGDVYHYEVEDGGGSLLGHFQLSEHVYPPAPDFDGDCGLISLAFDPDFEDNGLFYVGACFGPSESGILRFTFDPDDYDGITGSAAHIIGEARGNDRAMHNVGQMGFDEDGYLYTTFGDHGEPEWGFERENILGSLLRIVPNRDPGGDGYAPAPGNPYIGNTEGWSEAIYAYGFRSPWTGHLDSRGRWWVGDVGSAPPWAVEEINVVTEPGSFFGWPIYEGPCEEMCDELTDPIRYWDHSSAHPYVAEMERPYPSPSRVAWVGVEYRDRGDDPYDGTLTGRMLYGEMCVGFVRAIELDATGEVLFDGLVGELAKISAWDQGADGYLYASTYGACEAQRAVPDVPAGLWRAVPADP